METNIEKNLPEKIWNPVKGKKRYLRCEKEGDGGATPAPVKNLSFGLNKVFLNETVLLHKALCSKWVILWVYVSRGTFSPNTSPNLGCYIVALMLHKLIK